MCVMCNPAFADAFRNYAFPSRRQILRSAAAATASAFICETATSAAAQAEEASLQDLANRFDQPSLPRVTIFRAREIITLDPDKPSTTGVAVLGDRILAVGSVDELQSVAGGQPYVIDDTFADKVITPGLIAQHDHPLLTGLTMVSEIIAIEDWVLPSGVVPAANSPSEYRARLAAANAKLANPVELLVTWGYHPVFHGPLTRSDLDQISSTRPIIVWHRSAHEFIVNSKALRAYGIDAAFVADLPAAAQKQCDLAEGHFWEGGMFGVITKLLPAIATPDRLRRGLEFVVRYYHANGVTLGCEPGGLFSKQLQDAQNAVLSRADSPFRFYFIPDGKSINAAFPDTTISETEKVLGWGEGMTAMMPGAIKLFADGAIYSLAMRVREPYSGGGNGEWIMEPEFFARAFKVYWDAGYQIHVHVNGDAGLDTVLDNVETNMRRHPRYDHRTVAIHLAVSQKDQVERMRRLGVIVSANPYYVRALADAYSKDGLGPERADNMVRLGDIERAGISYSLHSDMPMAPGQPLFLMHCAVNRTTVSGRVAAPDQRATRLGALKGVALSAAHSLRLENDMGSIVTGKLANFSILEDNPLTVDAAKIKDIPVWGTVFEGKMRPVV
ncbi:amidohydrolase [Chelatococcus asaccharovorans]|uniref:amidohydrolase n=1 Tax=Chelatococcus asaccharovorans TaxID=28210 RepID=UPI00224C6BDB|nr:amidohydrolase [Chelatococcus asaccharovorans]CAH1668962.1 Amidohydro_3 domain-containing protein [Chelatococcus asaccharovorans]CAH1679617.1 Amidohydro_3 domain-containing protein [Chelatococcus asaccharovorans]